MVHIAQVNLFGALDTGVKVELVDPSTLLGVVSRCIMDDRLAGGRGRFSVPPNLPVAEGYCFAAFCHTPLTSSCVVRVLGGLEAHVSTGGLILFISGLGAMGNGAGRALAMKMWDFARACGCKALMLKARPGIIKTAVCASFCRDRV